MILLADSGSTKTDWCVVDNGQAALTIKTKGTNPFFQTEEEIAEEIKSSLFPSLPTTQIEDVYFYGAGCTLEKLDRKSTRLNSSHANISYAVFCLKKNKSFLIGRLLNSFS